MKLSSKQEGFTIIEVMIVLAIAGLIMVVALIAIPQLQRNQRNNARQSILARISTEVGNYIGNNNGTPPTANNNATTGWSGGFRTRYLTNVDINDPQTGTAMVSGLPATAITEVPAVGTVFYATSAACDGEARVAASARQYAVWTQLEGGAVYCLDNS